MGKLIVSLAGLHTFLKNSLFLFLCFVPGHFLFGQSITNGNFSSGTASWGCGAETNPVSVYGGSGSDPVAEVDAAAGLCQTVTGLTIGNTYRLSFVASRRTGGCPSPATTNVNITVSGGVLSATVTRTNTTFALTTSDFLFTANSTSHVITFGPGAGFGSSTCGMIIDNIAIAFSPLPIELISFKAKRQHATIYFDWITASEKNNAYFVIERSVNGLDFEAALRVDSKSKAGNSSTALHYNATLQHARAGMLYYRLKQYDFDGRNSSSELIVISPLAETLFETSVFPNPNTGKFYVRTPLKGKIKIRILNSVGELVHAEESFADLESNQVHVGIEKELPGGLYVGLLESDYSQQSFKFTVE